MKKSYLCLEDLLLTKNKFMKKNLSLKLMLLWMASIMFALNLSAQTVSLSAEQCGHAIQYGNPIFCTPNDSATEYPSGTYMVEIRSCYNKIIQTKVVKI